MLKVHLAGSMNIWFLSKRGDNMDWGYSTGERRLNSWQFVHLGFFSLVGLKAVWGAYFIKEMVQVGKLQLTFSSTVAHDLHCLFFLKLLSVKTDLKSPSVTCRLPHGATVSPCFFHWLKRFSISTTVSFTFRWKTQAVHENQSRSRLWKQPPTFLKWVAKQSGMLMMDGLQVWPST